LRLSVRTQETRARTANSPWMDQSFWDQNGDWISAAITMALTIGIAIVVDRYVLAHAGRYATRVADVSRAANTRLRLVRRLIFVVILVIGASIALNYVAKLDKLATGLLASSAVIALIAGLAARQVLANPLAGIMLAITQPIRIGDTITIDEQDGRVEDLTLSYTFIDTGDGRLMVVPNEHIVTSVLFNRSTGDSSAPATASVWLPLDADLRKARSVLEPLDFTSINVAEITADGVRVEVQGASDPTRTVMAGEEAALRETAHKALREAGVLAAT
jgi:small-conductance mechanosensitive channel